MKSKHIFMLTMMIGLSACGGRVAHPIAETRVLDAQLSCTHLRGEYDNNVYRIAELAGERQASMVNNAGWMIASPLLLDLSDTVRTETEALIARNEHIKSLIEDRGCE